METNAYKEDLEYLYSSLLNHPSIILGEKKKAEFEALYLAICEVVYDYDSFIDGATKLTTFFQDGHTNIEIPYTSQDLCLNLKCCWSGANDNELILEDEYEDIPKHARIMGVEGMSIEDLIVALADKIPHENIYCKVSHNTFSSARTFAVTLKDNGIATICGVPTGGKPNSFGMPKKMSMPKTDIRFRVSRCCFLRPNASGDEESALMPEIEDVCFESNTGGSRVE